MDTPNNFGLRVFFQETYEAAWNPRTILTLWLRCKVRDSGPTIGRFEGYYYARHAWLVSQMAERSDTVDEQPSASEDMDGDEEAWSSYDDT